LFGLGETLTLGVEVFGLWSCIDGMMMHPSRLSFCFDGFLHFVWFWGWMSLVVDVYPGHSPT
jgi:hypothetical protein